MGFELRHGWNAATPTICSADTIFQEQLSRAKEILKWNRSACEHLVARLVDRRELSGREVINALCEERTSNRSGVKASQLNKPAVPRYARNYRLARDRCRVLHDRSRNRCPSANTIFAIVRVRAKSPAVAVAGRSWIQEFASRGFDSQSVVETIHRGLWFLILPKKSPAWALAGRGREDERERQGREIPTVSAA